MKKNWPLWGWSFEYYHQFAYDWLRIKWSTGKASFNPGGNGREAGNPYNSYDNFERDTEQPSLMKIILCCMILYWTNALVRWFIRFILHWRPYRRRTHRKQGAEKCMSNQGKLIEQLFCVYHDTLKKYCMHCFHYQSQYMPYVDDCIQEVFIAALRKEKKLASHPNPYAWLANACRKQCATILRQKAVRARITGQQVWALARPSRKQESTGSIGDRWGKGWYDSKLVYSTECRWTLCNWKASDWWSGMAACRLLLYWKNEKVSLPERSECWLPIRPAGLRKLLRLLNGTKTW